MLLIAELVTVVESTVYRLYCMHVAEYIRRSDRQTHFNANYKTYS